MTRKRAVKLLMSYGIDRNTAALALDKRPKRVSNKMTVACVRMAYALAKVAALSFAAAAASARLAICAQELASSTRLEANQDQPSD